MFRTSARPDYSAVSAAREVASTPPPAAPALFRLAEAEVADRGSKAAQASVRAGAGGQLSQLNVLNGLVDTGAGVGGFGSARATANASAELRSSRAVSHGPEQRPAESKAALGLRASSHGPRRREALPDPALAPYGVANAPGHGGAERRAPPRAPPKGTAERHDIVRHVPALAALPAAEVISRPSTGGRPASVTSARSVAALPPRPATAGSSCTPAAIGVSPSRHAELQSAADEAFDRAMRQLGVVRGPASEEASSVMEYFPSGKVPELGHKLPSAVTVGGVPVAADGDLVYLGGGLYAAASSMPKESTQKPMPRTVPARARGPRTRPLGPRSAVRSASAHLVGPQTFDGEPGIQSERGPSRAQSDGQIGLGGLGPGYGYGYGAPGPASSAGSERDSSKAAPRAWRPSGVSKLPPPPALPSEQSISSSRATEASQPPGAHSEARAEARVANRREGVGLFGAHGILGQIREAECSAERSQAPMAPAGPPMNGAKREAERRAAKELKVQQMLEERAIRLATEAAAKAPLQRNSYSSASAPELRLDLSATRNTKEELEKQKLRVACKMEILDFFNGYSKAVGKMTADQTKILLSKLHSSADEGNLTTTMQQLEQQQYEHLAEWSEKSAKVDDQQSIQRRLRQVNDLCNRVFEEP